MILSKQNVFSSLLDEGHVVQVQIANSPDVMVPSFIKESAVLEYGLNMPNPIHDLQWTDEGIHATLSFNMEPFKTFVPWESIAGMKAVGQDVVVIWKLTGKKQGLQSNNKEQTPQKPTLSVVR